MSQKSNFKLGDVVRFKPLIHSLKYSIFYNKIAVIEDIDFNIIDFNIKIYDKATGYKIRFKTVGIAMGIDNNLRGSSLWVEKSDIKLIGKQLKLSL